MINMQLGLFFSYYYHTFMLLLIRMQYGGGGYYYVLSRPPYLWEGLHTHHHCTRTEE